MHWQWSKINCLSKGGLTRVHSGDLPTFLMAQELFQKDTMGNPHRIDVAEMVVQLPTKSEVISILNNIVEESGINFFFAWIEN